VNTHSFLETALPTEGYLCAVGIKDEVVKPRFVTGIASLLEAAKEFDESGHDTYFACHSFAHKRRIQDNALRVRSFYLDIDCGVEKAEQGKGYETKSDAVLALKEFSKTLGLPRPYIIDSGRGIHVYWLMDNDVTRDEWRPVARAFKRAALQLGLVIDPAVPSDAARILRVPGTRNFKDKENPLAVVLLQSGVHITLEQMQAAVKPYMVATTDKRNWRADATTQALLGNYQSNFGKIARLSLKGEGCAQIKDALENAKDQSYDAWLAVLTIASRCSDADTAIHKVSKGHPNYDYTDTEDKADEARESMGPRTCAWYRIESGNSTKLCEGCKHTVTSPIQLGRVVIEAPAAEITPDESDGTSGDGIARVAYDVPFGYFRGQAGGVYRRDRMANGEFEEVPVCEDDFYVVKRVTDPEHGVCAVLRLHPPHDAVSEFAVPLKHIQSFDKFRDIMSEKGVVASKKGMENLMAYTTAYVKMLRNQLKAEEARTQFGWADRHTKFILGSAEISGKDVRHSPSSSVTELLAPLLQPVGDLSEWRRVFNMYTKTSGSEAQVFALMSAFGAPLMNFTGSAGALVSLVNTDSGTGKTSILRLINSVWGHPDELVLLQKDTVAAKQHRMGIMNSLPITLDEMTNSRPEDLSDLAYAISHGRGRNRMRADANMERVNNTRWSTIAVSTGNASIVDKLASNKATSEGEQMRVMEFKIAMIAVDDAQAMLNSLNTNYGVAGPLYAQALINSYSKIPLWINRTVDKLIEAAGGQIKERFWFHATACNLVGGHIAQKIGLNDYNMDAVFDWAVDHIKQQRRVVKEHVVSSSDALGEYLSDNFGSVLVVDVNKVNPITMTNVIKPAVGRISARFEADSSTMFIPKKDFKEYCVKRQIDLDGSLRSRSADFTYKGTVKKRMASGTGMVAPAVDVFEFSIAGDLRESMATLNND
jgi:hypothetical protein